MSRGVSADRPEQSPTSPKTQKSCKKQKFIDKEGKPIKPIFDN